jgi:hypothetical protein
MKTLSQLKKDIQIGTRIVCTDFVWCRTERTPEKYGVPVAMQGVRMVDKINTVGFYLKHEGDARSSFFDWPKASELNYYDNTIVVSPKNKDGDVFQVRTYKIG